MICGLECTYRDNCTTGGSTVQGECDSTINVYNISYDILEFELPFPFLQAGETVSAFRKFRETCQIRCDAGCAHV